MPDFPISAAQHNLFGSFCPCRSRKPATGGAAEMVGFWISPVYNTYERNATNRNLTGGTHAVGGFLLQKDVEQEKPNMFRLFLLANTTYSVFVLTFSHM